LKINLKIFIWDFITKIGINGINKVIIEPDIWISAQKGLFYHFQQHQACANSYFFTKNFQIWH